MGIVGKVQDYEGEDHAKTLIAAHAIRTDKKKHANAMKHVKKMAKTSTHAGNTHKHERQAAPMAQQMAQQSQGSTTNAEGSPAEEQAESPMQEQMEQE